MQQVREWINIPKPRTPHTQASHGIVDLCDDVAHLLMIIVSWFLPHHWRHRFRQPAHWGCESGCSRYQPGHRRNCPSYQGPREQEWAGHHWCSQNFTDYCAGNIPLAEDQRRIYSISFLNRSWFFTFSCQHCWYAIHTSLLIIDYLCCRKVQKPTPTPP